jgi:hypothetical protein
MEVIETFIEAKTGDLATCEDLIVESEQFLAVFDGATDKTDARYDGLAGGQFAARNLAETLSRLPPDASAADCVEAMSDRLRQGTAECGPMRPPEEGPSASVLVFSASRSEIWRVGDCSWAMGDEVHQGSKLIDAIVAAARAALLEALLDSGATVDELRATDPGRAMLMPLLENQHRFRNSERVPDEYGFGVLDGQPVPARFIEVIPVAGGDEIVFATDGYPHVLPSLGESEAFLAEDLAVDPLRIGRHKSTKGVRPGFASFDDRAYLRFRA